MRSTKKFNLELYDRLHPISRPTKTTNTNPCSITNQIGQLHYHHIYLCDNYHQLLIVIIVITILIQDHMTQDSRNLVTITPFYFIFAIFQNPSISFKPVCYGRMRSSSFPYCSYKLALLILYSSTLWHGGIIL